MDKLRVAIIGAGSWGKAHAKIYSNHHLSELVAVCDISEKRAKDLAQEFNVKYFSNYEKMLDSVECDAVAVVTPDFAHAKPVVEAAKRNKHILCEKPLATSVEDIELKELVTKVLEYCLKALKTIIIRKLNSFYLNQV